MIFLAAIKKFSLLLLLFTTLAMHSHNTLREEGAHFIKKQTPKFELIKERGAAQQKHCMAAIKIKQQGLYGQDHWHATAKKKATQKWQTTAKARFGSVYSSWQNAEQQHANCTRIGIGSDLEGNVGAVVLCHINAKPCAVTSQNTEQKTKPLK